MSNACDSSDGAGETDSCSSESDSIACSPPVKPPRRSLAAKQVNAEANEASDRSNRRRSTRHRSPAKRYSENFVQPTLRKGSRQRKTDSQDDADESELEVAKLDSEDEQALDELAGKVKATSLFEDRTDVEGQKLYGFKTPKKKGSLNVLASSVQKTPSGGTPRRRTVNKLPITPKTPKTPSTSKGRSRADLVKTPHVERNKLKKDISKIIEYENASDFSVSESDYAPSSEEDSNEDSDEVDDDDEQAKDSSPDDVKPKRPVIRSQFAAISVAAAAKTSAPVEQRISSRTRRRSSKKTDLQYVVQSDDYFTTHSSTKIITSDHTLDRLNTPRLPHDQLFRVLKELRGTAEHERAIKELHEEYESYFAKWLFLMNEGFNILLYGLGSKRNLIQTFHRNVLADQPVVVINGFFPTLSLKDVLDAITADILDMTVSSANFHEVVDMIEKEFSYLPDTHLFLIVHNLDGIMLRNSKSQNVLARLAGIANIHLIASIDHINTPLIWDSSKLSCYNFSWWDVTTMLPYSDETSFENSLLVQNSGGLALSSMKNVFQSLTTNSRGIFLAIVKHQLANGGNPQYQGMLFKDLYWNCREAFLVSTDLALRAQLTEFIDHKLVRVKRTVDGAENLLVPIEHGLLQQFLQENEEQ
ncbi:origin recognition complex subunit 2 [Toxorhynchites rutilus septentrionalis]|uniref:origin recognition complex subunit 2 n=1 Tax=Toxorhynchites rutilus septentrionalis TaxID=329112 RepID=UPI00247AF265|nr:origin recognition complex subunit 2 [Toxorhynchites rutilus septentrionalis]